jgi:hypothetical protein
MAAHLDFELHQIDIKGAYLNGELTSREQIYMKQPPGYPALVFTGPVHRTEKKSETGPNWTGKDRTRGLFMDRSFAVQLLVFHFEKYSRTD